MVKSRRSACCTKQGDIDGRGNATISTKETTSTIKIGDWGERFVLADAVQQGQILF